MVPSEEEEDLETTSEEKASEVVANRECVVAAVETCA